MLKDYVLTASNSFFLKNCRMKQFLSHLKLRLDIVTSTSVCLQSNKNHLMAFELGNIGV